MLLAIAGTFLLAPLLARGADSGEIVAVYSSISPAYTRTPVAGGHFKAESYAFGDGGQLSGTQKDNTIDKLPFLAIARLIAPSLAAKNYVPCDTANPRQTDLLIMVFWGTTVGTDNTANQSEYQIAESLVPPPLPPMSPPPTGQGGTAMVSDPSTSGRGSEGNARAAQKAANDSALQQSLILTHMANRQRDRQNLDNAAILGYLPEMQKVQGYEMSLAVSQRRQDVIDEVADSRYYVVLMAYDFQALLQHKGRKLLWETRFSIRQRRNDFSKQLASMALSASRYFGQDSNGLARTTLPEGHVEMNEPKFIGFEPEKK